ncbi:serine protein kinase RIO [Candidatus Woesearchaeota archaeon]|nr:MAG: serine protein kinase RIO [Candidatus Woesearchaeota archaeon]
MRKQTKEKHKTMKHVFDAFTERNLFKLSSRGYFDELESPIAMGKEANIFLARKRDKKVIVKIYRLSTCDFFKMYEYIRADPRFNVEKNRRKVIFAWAKREYSNLLRARKNGVRVPTAHGYLYNILVMELIGDEQPAPLLKDSKPKDPKEFLKATITQIKKLYQAGLVHGDLSAFNIINHEEKPVLIDLSQATPLENPQAEEYLKRDIHNICTYFKKLGTDCDEKSILKEIKNKMKQ